jgi:membrane protein YqaA with SNARE-associated domain
MKSVVAWIQSVAVALGAPGLFLIGFLDSSFLSFPEVNDLLLVLMVTQHKERMLLYAASATLGSLAGCLVLFSLGRRGGAGFVQRRFGSGAAERTLEQVRRFGVLAILVPSLLPPPAPFKIFVLLAGVSGMSPRRFTASVLVGRGLRYFGEGALALRYGDNAITFLEENGRTVTLTLVAALVVGAAALVLWRYRPAPQHR